MQTTRLPAVVDIPFFAAHNFRAEMKSRIFEQSQIFVPGSLPGVVYVFRLVKILCPRTGNFGLVMWQSCQPLLDLY
jgi:hypothetical protein